MPNIKQITIPNGAGTQTFDIVDQGARELIAGLSGSTQYLGVTTTELVDNVTTNPSITVGGETVTASGGGIATYGNKEFIYNGTVWQEFGDLSALGDLAFADTASGTVKPTGTVNVSTNATTNKTATVSKTTGTATYTPEGTVSKPNVTVTPSTTTVNSITNVGTLPELTMTVANENLSISFSKGTLPTKGSDTSVMTGASAELASAPAFTGTGARLVTGNIAVPSTYTATFTGDEKTVTVTPN